MIKNCMNIRQIYLGLSGSKRQVGKISADLSHIFFFASCPALLSFHSVKLLTIPISLPLQLIQAYLERAQELVVNENILLQTLGFDVAIDHPHTHVVKCCQLVRGEYFKNKLGRTTAAHVDPVNLSGISQR